MRQRITQVVVFSSVVILAPCILAQQQASSANPNSAAQHSGAQASAVPGSSAGSAAQTRTAEITIRGCVTGENRYTFVQESTGAIFDLTGDTGHFADIRGKLIEVTGNEFAPQANSGELPKLQIKNFHVIADKCPIQAQAPPRTTTVPAEQGPPTPASPTTPRYRDPGTVTQTPPNANPNVSGDTGSPSPGTGNPPPKPPQ